jgi:hypothetical protein
MTVHSLKAGVGRGIDDSQGRLHVDQVRREERRGEHKDQEELRSSTAINYPRT